MIKSVTSESEAAHRPIQVKQRLEGMDKRSEP